MSERVKVLLAGNTRNLAGVNYKVYPCVLLVHGVHHGIGSDPLYYPDDVLNGSAPFWNNVPVTIGHPEVNGKHIMCNHDGTIRTEWQVGHVTNVVYEGGKLKGEVWLNVDLIKNKQPDLLDFVENGGQLEVSTGLLAGEDGISGAWNGESYAASILEIVPDHLALLPGSTGACSWGDGCGLRANANGTIDVTTLSSYAGKKPDKKHSIVFCEMSLNERLEKVSQYVDSLDVMGQEGYTKINHVRSVYSDYFVYVEITGENQKKLYKQQYMLDNNGNIVVDTDPVEVVEEVTYKIKANKSKGVKNMSAETCCPKKVADLIANENNSYSEEDKGWLEGLNEAELEKLVANSTKPEPKVKNEGDVSTAPKDQLASYLKGVPSAVATVINEGLRTLDEKRASLIGKITTVSDKFNEKQLVEMPTETLEGIASMIPTKETVDPISNFAMSFPANIVNEDHEEEPYVPQTLSASLGK